MCHTSSQLYVTVHDFFHYQTPSSAINPLISVNTPITAVAMAQGTIRSASQATALTPPPRATRPRPLATCGHLKPQRTFFFFAIAMHLA